jgi:ABC-type transporter Mla subunit MlaD
MTTAARDDLCAIADRLEALRDQLCDLTAEAADLLRGLGPSRDRARAWLEHLDRAAGTEPTTTIDDTIEELRQAAACPPAPTE